MERPRSESKADIIQELTIRVAKDGVARRAAFLAFVRADIWRATTCLVVKRRLEKACHLMVTGFAERNCLSAGF
jgi:hypothetical protein